MFNLGYGHKFEEKALHCGLAPKIAYQYGNYAPFILKHYGLKDKEDRERKVFLGKEIVTEKLGQMFK